MWKHYAEIKENKMLRSLFEMIARTCGNLKDGKICTIKHEKIERDHFHCKATNTNYSSGCEKKCCDWNV